MRKLFKISATCSLMQQCTSVSALYSELTGQKEQGALRYRKMLAFRLVFWYHISVGNKYLPGKQFSRF